MKALAPVQKAQEPWYTANKQVCASCHHQYQPSLAFRAARERGVPVNEAIARADAAKAFTFADIDKAIQYQYVIEPSVDDAYRMMAAHAAGMPPNLGAAIYARLLISRQNADGTWDGFHQRPPSSYSRFTMATLGLRAVQLYRHASQKAAADAAVARARGYLEKNAAPDTEGRAYQLLGLKWAGAEAARLRRLGRELVATQQADGGWESRAGRGSDVYSTGQALVGAARRRRAGRHRCRLPQGHRVPAEDPGRRRHLARHDAAASAGAAEPAVLQRRLSLRARSVPVDERRELGDHGALVRPRTGAAGAARAGAGHAAGRRRALGRDRRVRLGGRPAPPARRRARARTPPPRPAARRC